MKKKIILAIACMALFMLFSATPDVQAASHYTEWKKSSSSSFKKKWSDTKAWYIENEAGLYVSTTFGYDTFAVNEDYVTNCKGTLGHKAYVCNSQGSSKNTGWYKGSTSANGNPSSKADIKHTGVSVVYRLYADY